LSGQRRDVAEQMTRKAMMNELNMRIRTTWEGDAEHAAEFHKKIVMTVTTKWER
jgi:hypothetical protein